MRSTPSRPESEWYKINLKIQKSFGGGSEAILGSKIFV